MHNHAHGHGTDLSDRRLFAAISINLLLTLIEGVAGILSGSLSLLADAVHNFSDVGSLLLAFVARKVARRQADERRTFGYGRAEVIGALINLTALVVIAVYLVVEAILRYFSPQIIDGWTVLFVASAALVIDLATAALLYKQSRESVNLRAAFLHNLTDALASVGVIVVAFAVIQYEFYLADVLITLVISAYIIWQSLAVMRTAIAVLMQSVPDRFDLHKIVASLSAIDGVRDVHHVHIWQIDEHDAFFEAHVVIDDCDLVEIESIKRTIKQRLAAEFAIHHSTLEFESQATADGPDHESTTIVGH